MKGGWRLEGTREERYAGLSKGGVAFVDASGRVLCKRPSTGAELARRWRLSCAALGLVGGGWWPVKWEACAGLSWVGAGRAGSRNVSRWILKKRYLQRRDGVLFGKAEYKKRNRRKEEARKPRGTLSHNIT